MESISRRVATLEGTDRIGAIITVGDPDGVVSGVVGTIAIDKVNTIAYMCFGSTVWRRITV